MNKENFISEELLLLERPNIRMECKINSDDEMNNYLKVYNTYNDLLIQFFMKQYYLLEVDRELQKHCDIFPVVSNDMKDLYQTSSSEYLKYFYLRNNLYIERLSQGDINYLLSISENENLVLDEKNKKFIENTYLKVILENPSLENVNVNYGPDNKKYIRPSNAIIIGVRYNQFSNLPKDENIFSSFGSAESKLKILTNFLEYKIKNEYNVPFYVIEYDEFSVKKKISFGNKRR